MRRNLWRSVSRANITKDCNIDYNIEITRDYTVISATIPVNSNITQNFVGVHGRNILAKTNFDLKVGHNSVIVQRYIL